MIDLLRPVPEIKYRQLCLSVELAAQQLFCLQDYFDLAKALQKNEAALADPDIQRQTQIIAERFMVHAINHNTLIQVLMDLGILMRPEHQEGVDKEPTPPSKPSLKIVK